MPDLLLRAEHLFVAAIFRLPDEGGTLGAQAPRNIADRLAPRPGSPLLLLRAKSLFVAAILWPSLNPVAPHDDKRVIAMTNEGRPGPPPLRRVRPATCALADCSVRARLDERSYGVEWSE